MASLFSMRAFKKQRQAASAFLLGCFLTLQAMAALPALHAWVHPDAADPQHECAVTLFAHGQVHASAATPVLRPAPERVSFSTPPPAVIFVSADIRLLPSRGPPAASVLA